MSFVKKTWSDRIAEFINRRELTKADGSMEIVTVARSEGTVLQEGDAFSAENMNDLEERINTSFSDVQNELDNINEESSKNNFGKQVVLLSYNSKTNKYTLPCDGYLRVAVGATTSSNSVTMYIFGADNNTDTHDMYIFVSNTNLNFVETDTIFAKKGMKVYAVISGGGAIATFTPLV